MIVLDTHTWLWWVAGSRKLSRRAREAIEADDRLGVCSVSAYEVAALSARGRVVLDRPVREWVATALGEERVETLELNAAVAVEAALLDRRSFPGDPVDRVIYATARMSRARLVTKDERLRSFDAERTLW